MKHFKYIIIILALISVIPFVSCNNTSNPYEDEIIKQLQEDNPFTIVTPTYLPKGMHLTQYGSPSKMVIGEGEIVQISLTYQDGGLDKSIHITEASIEMTYVLKPSDTFINIQGTQIIKYTVGLTLKINGLGYTWNMNGVNFDVNIYGYDEEECEKVISSMIP